MIDKNELLKLLPKLVRDNDEVKGAIITALSGVVATKEDIARIIEHSDRRFEAMQKQMDERFETMDKRFEAMDKRFETMDKRFEAMDKRFEAMDKRFEAMQKQMDKRFEEAREERKILVKKIDNLENSTIIIREVIGETLNRVNVMITKKELEDDIKKANKDILDYLKSRFEN